jgi:hypothetical protein
VDVKRLWKERARYKGTWGGRGSGKSNDRAMAVILKMICEPGTPATVDNHVAAGPPGQRVDDLALKVSQAFAHFAASICGLGVAVAAGRVERSGAPQFRA